MKKKLIGILVCTLLILTAIPAVGIMNIKTDNAVSEHESSSSDPVPDVECIGYIELYDVKPGETVHEFFHVKNVGEEGSFLDWEIESNPSWGREWEFIPESGENLEKYWPVLVEVFMKAPDIQDTNKFEGEIKVVNMDNPDDYDTVEFNIITARDRSSSDPLDKPVERFPTQSKSASSDPKPKLCCFGSIVLFNLNPGEEILEAVHIENCGEEGSLLNWKIESYPCWGTWTFEPVEGFNLPTGAGEWQTIKVYITAPDVPRTDGYTGKIKITNSDDPSDFCTINVVITLLKIHQLPYYHFLEQFPLLARLFSLPIFTRLLNLK